MVKNDMDVNVKMSMRDCPTLNLLNN